MEFEEDIRCEEERRKMTVEDIEGAWERKWEKNLEAEKKVANITKSGAYDIRFKIKKKILWYFSLGQECKYCRVLRKGCRLKKWERTWLRCWRHLGQWNWREHPAKHWCNKLFWRVVFWSNCCLVSFCVFIILTLLYRGRIERKKVCYIQRYHNFKKNRIYRALRAYKQFWPITHRCASNDKSHGPRADSNNTGSIRQSL